MTKYPVIPCLLEWFDAREAIFATDFGKLPLPDHKPYWDRLGAAENALMDKIREMRREILDAPKAL